MGPPPRPNPAIKQEKEEKEKISDISDISDAIWGSGVDLREEENYLTNTFRNQHSQSFESGTTSATNSFGQISQGSFGNQPAFGGSGSISQSIETQESVEQELNRKHQAAARAWALQHEHPLRDSFLSGNTMRFRIHQIAVNQGVTLDIKGLWEPERKPPGPPPTKPQGVNGVTAVGPDGVGIAAFQAKSIPETTSHAVLEESARYADILSLLSLAANERLRGLLDEAYTLARGRRYGDNGVVPPDLQDIATGEGRRSASVKATSITGTSWDKTQDEAEDGTVPKGMYIPWKSLGYLLICIIEAQPEPTVSFTSSLTSHLQKLAVSDRDMEVSRVKKRQERARKAAAAEKAALEGDGPITTGASTPSTPVTPAVDFATSVAGDKPMTKKEKERLAKLGNSDDALHNRANETAAMQLGFGKKKKTYNWMTGGAAAPSNPYTPKATKAATVTNGTKGDGKKSGTDKALQATERKWGSWRESGIEGQGIQIRDFAAVLERDGKDRKALHRCFMSMGLRDE